MEGIVLLASGWLGEVYDGVVIQCMIDSRQWGRGSGGLFNVRSGYGRWRVSGCDLAECRINIFHAQCQGANCPRPRNEVY